MSYTDVMAVTTNQGFILPDASDNANVPLSFTDFVITPGSGIENHTVQRYLSAADRTARNGTPNEGELSYLSDVNQYQSFNGTVWVNIGSAYYFATSTADTPSLTNVNQDVPGCTVTFSTATTNAVFYVNAVFDSKVFTTSGIKIMEGRLNVDGVVQIGEAIFVGNFNGARATVSQQYTGVLPLAGSHTLKLVAALDVSGGDYRMLFKHCSISVEIRELV